MKLLKSKGSNGYCGPAAVALLTGVHVDDAARTLRMVTGRRAVKGIANRHIVIALERLGHKPVALTPVPIPAAGRPTLTQALRGLLAGREPETRYLVNITGHYICIQGRKMWDNKLPEGAFLGECPYRRKRVKAIWHVTQKAKVAPPAKPLGFSRFVDALAKLNLETDGEMVDAPIGWRFQSGTHCLAITGTYEQTLAGIAPELPLVACPANCECRD